MSLRSLFSFRGSKDLRHKEPVWLNVYDLSKLNDYTIAVGLGVFHSGIQLYGVEYCYGGHDHRATTGITQMERQQCENRDDQREIFRFRERILLGHTNLSKQEVQRIVDRLGRRQFTGRSYHIVAHNCNHFSVAMSHILCGRPIPGWVNRLANLIARVPFLAHYLARPHQRRQRQRRPEPRAAQFRSTK